MPNPRQVRIYHCTICAWQGKVPYFAYRKRRTLKKLCPDCMADVQRVQRPSKRMRRESYVILPEVQTATGSE